MRPPGVQYQLDAAATSEANPGEDGDVRVPQMVHMNRQHLAENRDLLEKILIESQKQHDSATRALE